MNELSFALIWLGFFASIVLGLYFYFSARHKERMALIEKNADVTEIFKPREIRFCFLWLKLGMIALGIGIGFLCTAFLVSSKYQWRSLGDELFAGLSLFFGGLGVIIAHFIEKPKKQ